MAKNPVTRNELLNRWRDIEEEDEVIDIADSSNHNRLLQRKEEWFLDAFNFLTCLPREKHMWCGYSDLMGPLLETFYNYFKEVDGHSPLKLLWTRISVELRQCAQCIYQYHGAQEMYSVEYESSIVGPLLDVLQQLDEDRVTQHLKEINRRIALGEYVPARDDAEVVSVMFEVLMFPILLDDQSLTAEFQLFIEAIDNMHELTLTGDHQYPGVFALLFFKSARARSIGRRLAGNMGKLRTASDLEPLQPLLKKCIAFLETEELPSTLETSRPRLQLECTSVWHGINALLGFLGCSTFEEGILERYPIFLSIVLNHISDESLQFLHAVKCLKRLFEMLGCKLWLRSNLSASVMRNTLLGQCFRTRNEKSHKEIFDLFQPFLQSLEALQDGEHEEQRRHFLYFLLHQVTVSSNFSNLMKKKACQIALLIIHRGYRMNPPCPPFECAHMWGPSLVTSLKDSSLHSSLRQPAFDLIQTIIVSDAAALIMSIMTCRTSQSKCSNVSIDLDEENSDNGLLFGFDVDEDTSSWREFSEQGKNASMECRDWMCIPMLWSDVLVDINPSNFPMSFAKAVLWARSRFPMVEPENSTEMSVAVRDWLSSSATEISASFGWKVPTGSDDGGNGKESKNSVKLSVMLISLVRTFKRLIARFIVLMEPDIRKQFAWEPMMGESLMLLLLDPNDSVRHAGKCILEQVSNSRGLASGLQFLCSCESSLSAIFLGLRHALKLIQLDSDLLNFRALHNVFFILCKLLKEGSPNSQGNKPDDSSTCRFSSEGGFLRQPVVDSSSVNGNKQQANIGLESWEKFSYLLAETAWPIIQRCLVEGKAFIDYSYSQMTCVRLLEILPAAFERICASFHELSGNSIVMEAVFDFEWLNDLVEWGKSLVEVVVRYWRQTVASLMDLLKRSCNDRYLAAIKTIESILLADRFSVNELAKYVKSLSVSLSNEVFYKIGKAKSSLKESKFDDLLSKRELSTSFVQPSSLEDQDVQILSSVEAAEKVDKKNVIFLSDDEMERDISPVDVRASHNESKHCRLDPSMLLSAADSKASQSGIENKNAPETEVRKSILVPTADNKASQSMIENKNAPEADLSKDILRDFQKNVTYSFGIESQQDSAASKGKVAKSYFLKSKGIDDKNEVSVNNSFPPPCRASLKKSSDETIGSQCKNMVAEKGTRAIKGIVHDTENVSLEKGLKSEKRHQLCVTKPTVSVPKRQVVQLNLPMQNKSGYLHRLEAGVKRFKPPNLDDWYRPILEIDYFAAVGLSSVSDGVSQSCQRLKEVPIFFESPDQYVGIFRPLVLEEFKAQLCSSFAEASSLENMNYGNLSIMSVERLDDFHVVRGALDDNSSAASRDCSENDLVLLTRQPLKNSSPDVHLVGKVERREKDSKRRSNILYIRFYLQNGSPRLNRARKLLAERSKWCLSRIMSIAPQLREFQALSSVKYIPILPIILKPDSVSLGLQESQEFNLGKLSQPLQQMLKSSYNDSQLQAMSIAIGSSNSNKDFELSLIQGPPGTGKTRTIVAIVSSLLALFSKRTNVIKDYSIVNPISRSTSSTNPKSSVGQSAAIARAWQDAALARQLNKEEEKSHTSMVSSTGGRVLICAQSNAAVDELVSRISREGLYGINGKMYKPYLVRVGNAKTVHPNSLPFFIDTLVDNKLAEERMDTSNPGNLCGDSSAALRSNLEKLVDGIRFFEAQRANLRDKISNAKGSSGDKVPKGGEDKEMSDEEIDVKLKQLYKQKNEVYKDLASAQGREKRANEESRALRHKLRKSILKEAKIVVTTLSGCGGDLYGVCAESFSCHKYGNTSESSLFDAVVIDEAAQALEPATLIPLQLLRSKGIKCVMVGDPKQLPATVLSNVASKYSYECSMFERLQKAGYPVTMLTKQYRMHPEICRFPSMHFYDKKLLNGDQMSSKSTIFHETRGLGPYVFFDVADGREICGKSSGAMSLYNEHEVDASIEILRFFRNRYPSEFAGRRIGIITPYKQQLSLLRSRFSSAFGPAIMGDMEFNTVDGFQGREVDIVILSTVRAANQCVGAARVNSSSIGFVADVRRMNVALTRAKLSLWILGNARTLQMNLSWTALVKDATERDLVISCKKPYDSIFKSAVQMNHSSEKSDANLRSHVKGTNQQINQNTSTSKESTGRRMRRGSQKHRRNGSDFSAMDEGVQNYKRAARCGPISSPKEDEGNIGISKDLKSDISGENIRNKVNGGAENMEKQLNLGNAPKGKGKVIHDRDKTKQSLVASGSRKDSGDGCEAGNQVEIPSSLIAKRKQREAVDALLSSALISSRKTEGSVKSKPFKRPHSPTSSSGVGFKGPKARKDAR